MSNRPHSAADLVTVCDACLRASCWRGEFYCDDYLTAGTVRLKHATLERLDLEHADYRTTDAEYLNRTASSADRFPMTVASRCRAIEVTKRGHLSAGHMVDAIVAALREGDQ